MKEFEYRYEKTGTPYKLRAARHGYVVRTRNGEAAFTTDGPVGEFSESARANLASVTPLNLIPHAGAQILSGPLSRKGAATLREASNIRSVRPVLRAKDSRPCVATNNFYVEFHPWVPYEKCIDIMLKAGLQIKQRLPIAPNAWFAGFDDSASFEKVFATAKRLLARTQICHCYPELIGFRDLRTRFPQQWHLHETVIDEAVYNAHINVERAWQRTRGEETTIAVVDLGFYVEGHPEFNQPSKIVHPGIAGCRGAQPGIRNSGSHGTHCSGVACATGVRGASGVAPEARLMPISFDSNRLGCGSISQEVRAIVWAVEHGADVISCSWGARDNTNHRTVLQPCMRKAFNYALTEGRRGKGCVIVFAAGNGKEDIASDPYASYPGVIAVGACDALGRRSVFSDYGEALWCCAPSDGGRLPEIWTTDPAGASGKNNGSDDGKPTKFGDAEGWFTSMFGGTSASAACVAGVAALVISANKELYWHEVKDVIGRSCTKLGTGCGDWNRYHGYGRVDAEAAVALATSKT